MKLKYSRRALAQMIAHMVHDQTTLTNDLNT